MGIHKGSGQAADTFGLGNRLSEAGPMPATIRDVATQARVSVATVSRALSGRRRVSDENLRRVMGAAEELSYRPNLVATALRRQVTNTIGLVLPQISNPFFPTVVESIEWELQSTTRQLLLCDSRGDTAVEQQRLHALVDRRVDGIMISPCDALRSVDAVHSAALQVPLVQIDRRVTGDCDRLGRRRRSAWDATCRRALSSYRSAHGHLRRIVTDELFRFVASRSLCRGIAELRTQDLGTTPRRLHRRLGN